MNLFVNSGDEIAAILVHRWLPGSRKRKKKVHLWLQGVAFTSAIFGIWTKFQGREGVVANFSSLHSWMGLLCVSVFGVLVFINSLFYKKLQIRF